MAAEVDLPRVIPQRLFLGWSDYTQRDEATSVGNYEGNPLEGLDERVLPALIREVNWLEKHGVALPKNIYVQAASDTYLEGFADGHFALVGLNPKLTAKMDDLYLEDLVAHELLHLVHGGSSVETEGAMVRECTTSLLSLGARIWQHPTCPEAGTQASQLRPYWVGGYYHAPVLMAVFDAVASHHDDTVFKTWLWNLHTARSARKELDDFLHVLLDGSDFLAGISAYSRKLYRHYEAGQEHLEQLHRRCGHTLTDTVLITIGESLAAGELKSSDTPTGKLLKRLSPTTRNGETLLLRAHQASRELF